MHAIETIEKIGVAVSAICAVILFLAALIAWRDAKKKRQYEARQRQKKFKHQENIGRQIANFLNSEASYWLGLQNLKVVDYCAADYFNGAEPEYLVYVYSLCEPGNPKRLEITINMFGEVKKLGKPIRVHREGQVFDEMWPDDEASLKLLCEKLRAFVCSLHYAPTKEV